MHLYLQHGGDKEWRLNKGPHDKVGDIGNDETKREVLQGENRGEVYNYKDKGREDIFCLILYLLSKIALL